MKEITNKMVVKTISQEYRSISKFYGDKTAKRSGVPLMNHINEGLDILEAIYASQDAMRAFCIHPLIQEDKELANLVETESLLAFSPKVILLSMEYRARANDWLSDKVRKECSTDYNGEFAFDGSPNKGVLKEVHQMLIADKVQNYKDFEKYHLGRHHRSDELKVYFEQWLIELGVGRSYYKSLIDKL